MALFLTLFIVNVQHVNYYIFCNLKKQRSYTKVSTIRLVMQ